MGGGSAAWCSSVSPDTFPRLLEAVFFAPLLEVMAAEVATRGCPAIGDEAFAALCVLRVLQSSKSGRDFLRVHGIPNPPGLNRGHYFASLASKRRLAMLHDTLAAMGRKLLWALTMWKDNLAPMTCIPRPFDAADPANALPLADETVYLVPNPA